mgnify:CR=1 FL=1
MHNTMHHIRFINLICFAFCVGYFSFSHRAIADVITLQGLHFGEFVITDNNSVHGITVNIDGSVSHSGAVIEINAPRPGIYQIDGLPPNNVINVIVSQDQPMVGNSNSFNLTNFQESHTNSNAGGITDITIGATAETSGNGQPYVDQNYSGQVRIQISF